MNLRQLKSKIKSIQNVGQITRAMELVSAVKMKKAQERATHGKPYRLTLEETIESLVSTSAATEHPLMKVKTGAKKKLAIVISSNKGLAGVFNFNLFKFLDREIDNFNDYEFIVMGLKAQQFLYYMGGKIIADFSSQTPFLDNTTAIFTLARDRFVGGENSGVELYYNEFVSSLVYRPTKKTLLPFDLEVFKGGRPEGAAETKRPADYVIEPDVNGVLNGLFDFFLQSEIRGAVEESEAAEHSARMVAMKNATDNSKELVYRLTLYRNSLRQERITNELLDMNTARLAVS